MGGVAVPIGRVAVGEKQTFRSGVAKPPLSSIKEILLLLGAINWTKISAAVRVPMSKQTESS